MTIPIHTFEEITKIGEAQALVERARELICNATGGTEIAGWLKDAWADTLHDLFNALCLDDDDEDEVRLMIENTCKANLRAHRAAVEGKDLFSIIKDICSPGLETLEAAE